jgi:hypothetical protein
LYLTKVFYFNTVVLGQASGCSSTAQNNQYTNNVGMASHTEPTVYGSCDASITDIENPHDGVDGDDERDVGGYHSAPNQAQKKKKTRRQQQRLPPAGPMTRSKTRTLKKKDAT